MFINRSDHSPLVSVVLFCGIPGSGKTTCCASLSSLLFEQSFPHEVFSFDDFLLLNVQSSVDFSSELWKESRKQAISEFRKKISAEYGSSGRKLFIIDDNMFYRSMRQEVYRISRDANAGFTQVYCRCATNTALQRNDLRNCTERVSPKTFYNMLEKFDEPNSLRFGFERNTIIIDTSVDDVALSSHYLLQQIFRIHESNPFPIPINSRLHRNVFQAYDGLDGNEKEQLDETTCQSILFKIDQRTRKILHEIAKNVPKTKPYIIPRLNELRKQLLRDYKNGLKAKDLSIFFTTIMDSSQDFYLKHVEEDFVQVCSSILRG